MERMFRAHSGIRFLRCTLGGFLSIILSVRLEEIYELFIDVNQVASNLV